MIESRPFLNRLAILLLGTIAAGASASAELLFLSTQLRPIEEAQKMREVILNDFGQEVKYMPEDAGPFYTRIRAEAQAGEVTMGLIGGLHGDFPPVQEHLDPVDDVLDTLGDRELIEAFVNLGKLGSDQQYYIPWMQASYIMAANRKALEHLPDGADVNALTYEQLKQWAQNVNDATGDRKLGFPAGPKGLMHRFLQGYLYPSFTGGLVTTFKSEAAVAMWNEFKALWKLSNPRSTSYGFMQEPLLAGEVWIAFDHTARLMDALRQKPEEFIAFPAPAGPAGRGFMPVVAGLAIPKDTPDREASVALIEYLTRPEVQVTTLREVSFYPVVKAEMPEDLSEGTRMAAAAISGQSGAADALPSLLPVGLGEEGGKFNKVFLDTFQRIVIRGQDVPDALETEAGNIGRILDATGAPCWAPDPPSDGPCQVQ